MSALRLLGGGLILLFCLAVRADNIDDLIQKEMLAKHMPGVVVGIAHRGNILKLAAYGTANLEHDLPAKTNSVFELGAITAHFTAAAAMVLVQDGKLSLDESITRYLPGAPAKWQPITVRHLLNDTSGLKSFVSSTEKGFDLNDHLTPAQFIQKVGAWPVEQAPGEKATYCTTGYYLLSLIIQNVSGRNYWDFMQDRVFRPTDMTTAGDRNPSRIIPNRVDGYERVKGELQNRDFIFTDMFGCGAMSASALDLIKWDTSLGTEKVLSEASKQQMFTPATLNNGQKAIFGFGCRIKKAGPVTDIFTSGQTGGFTTAWHRYPEIGLCIVLLANSGETGAANSVATSIANTYFNDK